ncbi:GNAT family N-acetyltransferase [Herbiconiux moechotypicola]|uniref:N-acetyltransferase domain-containing protein n=1 Tax=Herbiconiux moechotypicola TaxID=637393 RepID=A0ABN3D759_9MICO|nr:GNAT family N-acetyltransferase [Herbiconiux moechotypicola]MCS5728489.1 GNAT family N-acetyltransferase [Herbiconiux moechotypicola]
MRTRRADPSEPAAHALLRDYFEYRASAFPVAGGYTVTYPDPAAFVPPAGVFLLLEDDEGRAVGCGGIRMLPSPAEGAVRYEVKHVWTDPAARGSGGATLLLTELESEARALGATELVLDTHHTLESARRLYARLGYLPTEPYNTNPNATRWYRKPI